MRTFFPTLAASAVIACAAPLMATAQDSSAQEEIAAPAIDVLPSSEDTISKYRNAGAWTIHKNETRGSCFASYESKAGAIVQFGLTKDEQFGYLGLFSQDAVVESGESDIAVIANGNLYSGKAMGVGANVKEGYQGGYMLINNREFVRDVEAGKELVAFPDTPQMYVVDMSGASNAVYETRKCTRELMAK